MFCRAREDAQKNRLYLHEVFPEENLSNPLQTAALQSRKPHGGIALARSVLNRLYTVNPASVSKVVDENGEPLVVYHGSRNFKPLEMEPGEAIFAPESYFAAYENYAKRYGETGAYFWDMKRPFDVRNPEDAKRLVEFLPNGYQFAIGKSGALDWGEMAAFEVDDLGAATAPSVSKYAAVVARYTNPDGTKKPGWLRAPNGKPTNLTERQWVQVRTPSFKKWFGDWEKAKAVEAAESFFNATAPVVALTGREFAPDGVKLTDKVPAFFQQEYSGYAVSSEFGRVELDREGVKDDLGHGMSSEKAAAFAAVHDVIDKGIVYNRSDDWKERRWASAVIAAPIRMGGEDWICEVIIQKRPNRTGFYLHGVEVKKKVEGSFKTPTQGGESPTSRLIISKLAAEVKRDQPSKIVG